MVDRATRSRQRNFLVGHSTIPSGEEDLEEPATLVAMKPSPCAKPSAQASPPRVREVR